MVVAKGIFIYALGAGNYSPVIYYLGDRKNSFRTRYVEAAILKLFPEYLSESLESSAGNLNWEWAKVIAVLTDVAKEKNYEAEDGLKKRMLELNVAEDRLEEILLSDMSFEEVLRAVYEVYAKIRKFLEEEFTEDEEDLYVVVDITHSFRSFAFAVLIESVVLKELFGGKVKEIYSFYGNFEAKSGDGYAPIVDVSSLMDLMDWIFTLREFRRYGKTYGLVNSYKGIAKKIYKKYREREELKRLKGYMDGVMNFVTRMESFASISHLPAVETLIKESAKDERFIRWLRGKEIDETASPVKDYELDLFLVSLDLLKEKVLEYLPSGGSSEVSFSRDEPFERLLCGVEGVRWCLEHGLIQQGYTMLEELLVDTVISFWEVYSGEKLGSSSDEKESGKQKDENMEIYKTLRLAISGLIEHFREYQNGKYHNETGRNWVEYLLTRGDKNKKLVDVLGSDRLVGIFNVLGKNRWLVEVGNGLIQNRNKLNHAWTAEKMSTLASESNKPEELENKLRELLEKYSEGLRKALETRNFS